MTKKIDNPYETPAAPLIQDKSAGRSAVRAIQRPWRTVWFRPRTTIRDLRDFPRRGWVIPLAALQGIALTLEDAWLQGGIANYFSWHRWALLSLPGGVALGVVILYLYSWMVFACGRALGGLGRVAAIRIAIAWSCIPFAPYIAIQLAAYWRLRESIFLLSPRPEPEFVRPVAILIGAKLLAGVWSLAIATGGVSVIHRLSVPRALAAMIAAAMALWLTSYLVVVAVIRALDIVSV